MIKRMYICNISTTRASVSPGYPNTRKQRYAYMASQMNRDVTACFGLPI